jgi:hypothetical protein
MPLSDDYDALWGSLGSLCLLALVDVEAIGHCRQYLLPANVASSQESDAHLGYKGLMPLASLYPGTLGQTR